MINSDIHLSIDNIFGNVNPEIFHYQNGTHPGINYYIKTIIPCLQSDYSDLNDFCCAWETLKDTYPKLIKFVDIAIDWYGNRINGWKTIWIHQKIDIIWEYNSYTGLEYQIIEYNDGLKSSAIKSLDWLAELTNRQLQNNKVCYEKLKEISEFLNKYTSDAEAIKLRSKLKVITNDKLLTQTVNRNKLDP